MGAASIPGAVNERALPLWKKPWGVSLGIHLGAVLLIGLSLFDWKTDSTVDFEVYEVPKVATQAPISLMKPPPPKPVAPEKRAVFGASRNTIRDDSAASGVSVKGGNTVAKTPDDEKLRDDDADSIPIPVEEYLVSAMPVLETEFRIPYPPEAQKASVQGRVVMDLLVDSRGAVREATLIQGPGYGLNEAALNAVKNFRFKPARVQDQAVAVRIRYAYQFVLER